ncbi:MAG: MerR family transcriptional regulator [Streptosporangiaceae bacterium]|nr:MerR family transcriptional regulator [Streptosporangiaceae bacterium]MBV9857120.1 MerR family transcriptional regulator [Streptosporangiaceae bacterium]
MSLMGIGEFAELSWLSPRALRLYDELGLLPPARVDPDSGYRWYAPAQLEQARLVSSLRQLDIPLARIKVILALDAPAAAERVAAWWAEAEDRHAGRRDLAGYLIDRLNGKEPVMYDVQVRDVPARSLLSLLWRAHEDEVMARVKDLMHRLHPVAAPPPGDPVSAPFVVYHGEVSQDSDGPVEVCWPVPSEQAAQIAAQFPDLALRTEPAHQEAFAQPEQALPGPAQLVPVLEGLFAWVAARHRQPNGGLRQIMLFNLAERRTDMEWAVALRPAGK